MYLPDEYFLLLMATLARAVEMTDQYAESRDKAIEVANRFKELAMESREMLIESQNMVDHLLEKLERHG